MSDYFAATLRSFGFPGLAFDLDHESWRRLILTSALPMLIVATLLTNVALNFVFDSVFPGFFFPYSGFNEPPEAWARLSRVSSAISTGLLPVAVGLLFASGIQRWSRAEGSWMLLIGIVLATAAVGLGTTSASMYAIFDTEDAFLLRASTWTSLASSLGFLSVGYFFVALRSKATSPPRAYVRRRRLRPGT